jgi:hypothetical protein
MAITEWMPCGIIESAPNPQLGPSEFDVQTFEAGMENALGMLAQEPERLHGRGFVVLENGPLGPSIAVPRTGIYQINALMRFMPTCDDGNGRFEDMWDAETMDSHTMTTAGRAHLTGSRIVALRVLRDGMIEDTIEGKNEAYELCADEQMWVGHRVANFSGTVALKRHDRIVLQAWQNSGEDQMCFVRCSALCVN